VSKTRRLPVADINDPHLKGDWLPDTVRDAAINTWAYSDTEKSGLVWKAEQVSLVFPHDSICPLKWLRRYGDSNLSMASVVTPVVSNLITRMDKKYTKFVWSMIEFDEDIYAILYQLCCSIADTFVLGIGNTSILLWVVSVIQLIY
jgi:hypothetical protein